MKKFLSVLKTVRFVVLIIVITSLLCLNSCRTDGNPSSDSTSLKVTDNATGVNLKYGIHSYEFQQDELERFLVLLNELKIIKAECPVDELQGFGYYIEINLKNNNKLNVVVCTSYIGIAGVAYLTEFDSCWELILYLDNIFEREFHPYGE